MVNIFRALEFLGLSVWLGSDVFLSFVVAPGAFHLPALNRDQAGAIVGLALTKMHLIGIACGVAILLLRLLRNHALPRRIDPVQLCVGFMIVLTLCSQLAVTPRMAELRRLMGSIQATAPDSPLLAAFARLHLVSVTIESAVMLAGIACIFLMARKSHPNSHKP
jgi:hypothetical protein